MKNLPNWDRKIFKVTDSFWKSLLNLFLPPRCLKCGKVITEQEDGLCPECFKSIDFITGPYCRKCGHPFYEIPEHSKMLCPNCLRKKRTPFRLSRSVFCYDEASKNLILGFKFMDKTENAPVLARWMKYASRDIFSAGVDLIVPIPLHYTRLIKRRYNQSALLTRELSKLTGVPQDSTSVIRHRRTLPQVKFSGVARVKNVKDAFSVKNPAAVRGKRILLIDDVMTTGSTLKECALAIKRAGAKSVDALTVGRVC